MCAYSITAHMSLRATCWSITINNPDPKDFAVTMPMGWKMTGQDEVGESGTPHYQGMLTTPQCRFSQVKKLFPKAHIQVCRNKPALAQYVHKEESRVATRDDIKSEIPSLFDYQHTIARKWQDFQFDEFVTLWEKECKGDLGEIALKYVDHLVHQDIMDGVCGIEYIAINPMWRSAWKRFYRAMVHRENVLEAQRQTDRQTETSESPDENEIVYPEQIWQALRG